MAPKFGDPIFETRDVTPEYAAELLDANLNNRSKKLHKIREWAEDMSAGRWRLNGDTICIAKDGRLLDGQNRLRAVELSGVTVRMSFARDVDDDAQQTMDIGAKRNVADALKFRGVEVNGQKADGIAGGMLIWENATATTTRKIAYIEENVEAVGAAIEASKIAMKELRSQKLFGTAAMILMRIDAEKASEFLRLLGTGEMLARGNPILTLRNKFMQMERINVNHRGVLMDNLALVFKAWNAWREGRQLRVIKFGDSEAFPMPI